MTIQTIVGSQCSYYQRNPIDSLAEFDEFYAAVKRDHQLFVDAVSVQLKYLYCFQTHTYQHMNCTRMLLVLGF